MANRTELHQKIEELSQKLYTTNKMLAQNEELSMLDIDLLRKTTIDIYDNVNLLRLAKNDKTSPREPIKSAEPEIKKEAVKEIPAEPEPAESIEEETIAEEPLESTENIREFSAQPANPVNPESEKKIEDEVKTASEKTLVTDSQSAKTLAGTESEEPNDLAYRYSNTAVNDLKKAISIAKKFEYINTLFKGNHQSYATSIHQINNFEKGDEAFEFLNQLRKEYQWDEEEKNYLELADLVRRRFMKNR